MRAVRPGFARWWLVHAGFLMLLIATPGSSVAKRNGTFSGGASITQETVLHIENRRGDIVVRSGTGNVVQVTAYMRDSSEQGDVAGRYTAAEIIAYLERKPPIVQDGNELRVGAMIDKDFHLGVDISYDIVAPPWARLEIQSEHGTLQIHGVGQSIEVHKTSGQVSIQEPGGRMQVKCGDSPVQVFGTPRAEWTLESKFGNVDVVVPQDLAFELDAESGVGRLQSEFPLGEHEPGRFKGLLHGEGPRVQVRTEQGAIAIWQR